MPFLHLNDIEFWRKISLKDAENCISGGVPLDFKICLVCSESLATALSPIVDKRYRNFPEFW